MRIALVNPPFKGRFSRTSRSPAVTKGGTLYYPIWLAYAAGNAEQQGHEVLLLDAPARGLDLEATLAAVAEFAPDLAVVDTSTPSIYADASTAARIKSRCPDCFTLLVGTHPSALPCETLALESGLDAVALGEYDATVADLARALESGGDALAVAGLVVRDGDGTRRTPERERIRDLDGLPFVTRVYQDHLNIRDYFFAAASYPMVMIMTGRGCPHRCFFCVYPQVFHSRSYRTRSPENVVDEIAFVLREMPEVREIGIEDDCFTANPKRVARICELILERGLKPRWYCNVRGDLDYGLLRLMRKAGCRLVTVGFESGNQDVLDAMHKGERIERYEAFVRDARRAGVLVHGCIMLGNPGDTRLTAQQSFEFARRLDCDSMQFYPLYVYPGTEAYAWAKERGYLKTEDFSRWLTEDGLHNCVLETPELSSQDMVSLCDEHLRRYHLRPGYMARKALQGLLRPSEGYRTLKSARTFFGKLLAGRLGKGRPS